MTVCPKCKGYGIVGSAVPDILRGRGHIFSSIECPQCHGSGEIEMTNEEWFTSLPTEEKAEWLQEHMDCIGCPASQEKCHRYYDACKEVVMEWLKEIHNE